MSDRVFWRCSRRECKATAVTVGGRVEHVRILHTHKPPNAGEFFSSTATSASAAAATETNANFEAHRMRSHPTGRVRRRSHQQVQSQPQQQTVKSVKADTVEKNVHHSTMEPSVLPNLVDQDSMKQVAETVCK